MFQSVCSDSIHKYATCTYAVILLLQKIRYRMFDNITHYDTTIRTCSDQPCLNNSVQAFERCLHVTKDSFQYLIMGCTLRSCCADRDLCNSSTRVVYHHSVLVFHLCICLLITKIFTSTSWHGRRG